MRKKTYVLCGPFNADVIQIKCNLFHMSTWTRAFHLDMLIELPFIYMFHSLALNWNWNSKLRIKRKKKKNNNVSSVRNGNQSKWTANLNVSFYACCLWAVDSSLIGCTYILIDSNKNKHTKRISNRDESLNLSPREKFNALTEWLSQ